MENKEKLKIVFDFIADYLGQDPQPKPVDKIVNETETVDDLSPETEVTLNEDDDPLKRGYAIIQKLEERDKIESMAIAKDRNTQKLAKITKINEQHQRQDEFIKKHKSKKSKLICYNDETFIPIFLSEDGTHGVTIDEYGYDVMMSMDEINFKFLKKNSKSEEVTNTSERTGITLDDSGNIVKVKVPNLNEKPLDIKIPVMSRDLPSEDGKESESPNNID